MTKICNGLFYTYIRTTEIISKTEIYESIQKNVTVELENIYNKFNDGVQWRWAVRSSGNNIPFLNKNPLINNKIFTAIGEDSSDLSAAGQNATYLACKTEKDILKALAECWASPYSYKSVQYRKQHGLPIRCDLAVLIQKMVTADSAGVLFTCEPTTGNPLYMVVTSNYGLGEVRTNFKFAKQSFFVFQECCFWHNRTGHNCTEKRLQKTRIECILTVSW